MHKHYLLYGYGGAYNHGAEAIVKTTISLLRTISPNCHITLSTNFKEQDMEFNIPADEFCERDFHYVKLQKESEFKDDFEPKIYKSTIDCITNKTICLSIGGDNYCYPNWCRYAMIHNKALERGAKSILWSCSIDPEAVDDEMLYVLRSHHLITARDSITYNFLCEKGLNNVIKCSDIAFLLESEETTLPKEFQEGNSIALNISPLIMRREGKSEILIDSTVKLIEFILQNTDMSIVLVPHVVMPMDNDADAFAKLLEKLPSTSRICQVSEKLNAAQYKYIISKCRFLIAARTHACIAAYSSGVPCIALGYSSKSIGIAKDLNVLKYVLPISKLDNENQLKEMFYDLMENEDFIKEKLMIAMPEYTKFYRSEIIEVKYDI